MAGDKPYIGYDDTGVVNLENNEVGLKLLDKLSKISDGRRSVPLDQFDNIIYEHRYLYDSYNLLIGDTYFMIPPEFIAVTSESPHQSIITLRQENTQKMKGGYHKRMIMIDLVFNGTEQLNGYKVIGPEIDGDEGYYYVDGLRQLLAQFKCTPFLPITNELINNMYSIFTVALQSINISTIPELPGVMKAQITLQEVNMFPYLQMPDAAFKYMIDWDLFRFYYQRLLTEKHEYKKLQSLPEDKNFNRFKISILDESVFSSEKATKYNFLSIICDKKIVKTKEDGSKDETNYTTWVDSNTDNLVVSAFQCGYDNILTNIQLSDSGSPTVQFIGGLNTSYTILLQTTDYTVVQSLEQCQITNDVLTRGNRKLCSLGFVKLESELVEFTGSLFVVIDRVKTQTEPGYPGLYTVELTCVSYDIAQSERESLNGFLPFECKEEEKCGKYVKGEGFVSNHVHKEQAIEQSIDGLLTKTKQDAYAEHKLRNSVEVYPDLHLPTYAEVDNIVDKIRKFREKHKMSQLNYIKYPKAPSCMLHGMSTNNKLEFEFENADKSIIDVNSINDSVNQYDVYVDPDFYVFYPTSYLSFLGEYEDCYDAYNPKKREGFTTTMKTTESTVNGITASGPLADLFVKLAKSYEGCEYVSGAQGEPHKFINGRETFDCVGLVCFLLKKLGVMPADWYTYTITAHMNEHGADLYQEVPWSQMEPGDVLIEYNSTSRTIETCEHMVIYIGNGRIMHASKPVPYNAEDPSKGGGIKESNQYIEEAYGRCFRPKAFMESTQKDDIFVNDSTPFNPSGGTLSNDVANTISQTEKHNTEVTASILVHQDLGIWSEPSIQEMNEWINRVAPKNSPFRGQGGVFIAAGKISGLDPRYILAHAALESAWGTSWLALNKNNYFGIGAVDWDPLNQAKTFSTTSFSTTGTGSNLVTQIAPSSQIANSGLVVGITEGAKWIKRNYYDGDQKTLYDMRFDNGSWHQYATDPEWHIKIAEIMEGAPKNTNLTIQNTITYSEFKSICKAIMAETQGEKSDAEKAMAQVVYDRLTREQTVCGLSSILNEFSTNYPEELNSTIEDNVKAVFCRNEKYWPKHQVWHFSTQKNHSSYNNKEYDKIGELYTHTYWGKKNTKSSTKIFSITDIQGTGITSTRNIAYTQTVSHELTTIKTVKKFGQPVYIKTSAFLYNNSWNIFATKESEIARDELNSTEHIFNTSFCDEVQYSGRGKLVRAFPTYLFCILDDQAQWYDGRKLWTNYYVYKSMVDISVHSTNDMPTETATITVTNSYHNLDRMQGGLGSYKLSEDEDYSKFQRWWYSWTGTMPGFGPKLTDKLIKLHQVIYDQALLREGARVHLRMGYGSDPLSLAPVINGHVSDIALGDQITVVVTSDGNELIQHLVSTTSKSKDTNNGFLGIFGLGESQESSNIIADVMCKRASWVTHLAGDTFEASKYGIEHFGIYFNKSLFKSAKDDEVTIDEEKPEYIETDDSNVTTPTLPTWVVDKDITWDDIKNAFLNNDDALWQKLDNNAISFFGNMKENWNKLIENIDNTAVSSPEDETSEDSEEGNKLDKIANKFANFFTNAISDVQDSVFSEFGTNSNIASDIISDIWDAHQENYDLLKNIYKANYQRQHYIYTTAELIGTEYNEQNVVFNKYNMTPWDVFQVCTQQVPEYILKTTYHQFDSRLYFGLPFWMEKYRYNYLNGVVYEECKTAAQAHFVDSMDCIIDNQVKVTSKFSNTNIKVMYTRGSDLLSTDIIHSDDSIDSSKQKTVIMDSPITQDAIGPDVIYEFFGYDIGKSSARRIGISNLLYGWQQQYQGQLILMGHPGLKPHDYMMLNDTYANLYGLCTVREVTHSFNAYTGFTTSVVPGMVSFSTDQNSGLIQTSQNYLMLLNCFSSYTQVRKNLRNNYEKNIALIAEFENMQNKLKLAACKLSSLVNDQSKFNKISTDTSIALDIGTVFTLGGFSLEFIKSFFTLKHANDVVTKFQNSYNAAETVADATKMADKIIDAVKLTDKITDTVDNADNIIDAAKVANKIKKGVRVVSGSFKGIKASIGALKTATISSGTLAGGVPGIVIAIAWTAVDILLDELFEWLSNKNVCTLLPLWWEGYPFAAGVKDGEKILLTSSKAVGTDENNREDGIERSENEE